MLTFILSCRLIGRFEQGETVGSGGWHAAAAGTTAHLQGKSGLALLFCKILDSISYHFVEHRFIVSC
jgi:hypothetical protein